MTIGVVIVAYNNEHTIAACLRSVAREGITDIRVVDSCSSDQTVKILEKQGGHYTVLSENKGFSHAANIGASLLDSDYILFLNPDAELVPRAITSMQATIRALPHAGIIGGLLTDRHGVPEQDAWGEEISLLSIMLRHMRTKRSLNHVASVAWVSGGALLIPRTIFEKIGGFDEEFFLYWEDIDLCTRVRDRGFGVYIDPHARIVHVRGASSNDQKHKTELYDASANRYFQKHHHPLICICHLLLRRIYRLLHPLAR